MLHGLRLTPPRLQLLARLWLAGETGVPVPISEDGDLFVECHLAELISEPIGLLGRRLRITRVGEIYARDLCPDKRGPHEHH